MSNEKNKPVEKIRVRSAEVAIWKNIGDNGAYFTASPPQFSYRGKDGNYHTAKSLNGYNLVDGATALLKANEAMARLRYEAKKAGEQTAAEELGDDIPM